MPLTGDVHACGYVFTEGQDKPAHCPNCGLPSDAAAGKVATPEELQAEAEQLGKPDESESESGESGGERSFGSGPTY